MPSLVYSWKTSFWLERDMRGRKKLQEEKQLVTYLKNLRFVGASLNACASSLFHKAYYADHHFN